MIKENYPCQQTENVVEKTTWWKLPTTALTNYNDDDGPELHLGRGVRAREAAEEVRRRLRVRGGPAADPRVVADQRGAHGEGVVEAGGGGPRARGRVPGGGDRVEAHAADPGGVLPAHGGGGAGRAAVVVREGAGGDGGGHGGGGGGPPGGGRARQRGVPGGRRGVDGAGAGGDERVLGHLQGADHNRLGVVVPFFPQQDKRKGVESGEGTDKSYVY